MKIQKKYQGAVPLNRIANEHNESDINTYSTQYLNNKLVYVGLEQPTKGEDVWVKQGNNLWTGGSSFAVNVTNTINLYLKAGTYTLSVGSVTTNSPSATAHVGFTNASGEKFLIKFLEKGSNKKITFTLEQDAVQITMWSGDYWAQSNGYQTTYNNLMLVKGDKALPYEPYIAKEIYVKNGNGEYEEMRIFTYKIVETW